MCTLKFGKSCLASISGPGGAQVIVVLSHPKRSGGGFSFSPKLSPPCPDPRRIPHSSSSATTQARGLIRNPRSDETRARLE